MRNPWRCFFIFLLFLIVMPASSYSFLQEVEIADVRIPQTIAAGEYFPMDVVIANRADEIKNAVVLVETPATSSASYNFSLKPYEEKVVRVVIRAPSEEGQHPCIVKVVDGKNNVLSSRKMELFVDRAYLSLNVYPESVKAGDVVLIEGHLFIGGRPKEAAISLLLDGKLIRMLETDPDGYFEDRLEIKDAGIHTITVAYYGYDTSSKIYVQEDMTRGVEAKTPVDFEKDASRSLIDVVLSTKRLEVPLHGGNVLYVTVINHGESGTFWIKANGGSEIEVYSPASIFIGEREQKTLPIYIESRDSEYSVTDLLIEVYKDRELLKTERAEIVVLSAEPPEKETIPMIPSKGSMLSLVIVFVLILLLYNWRYSIESVFRGRKAPSRKEVSEIIQQIRGKARPLEPSQLGDRKSKEIYVPRQDQIIY